MEEHRQTATWKNQNKISRDGIALHSPMHKWTVEMKASIVLVSFQILVSLHILFRHLGCSKLQGGTAIVTLLFCQFVHRSQQEIMGSNPTGESACREAPTLTH